MSMAALAALGTMFIIFNQVLQNEIYEGVTMSNDSQFNFSVEDRQAAADYLSFWAIVPWLLALVSIGFLLMRSWQVRN